MAPDSNAASDSSAAADSAPAEMAASERLDGNPPTNIPPPRAKYDGRIVVAALLTVGVATGLVAWYWQTQQVAKPLAYWGPEVASEIRNAQDVELWKLEVATHAADVPAADRLESDGRTWKIVARQNITDDREGVPIRRALITRISFVWDAPPSDVPPAWAFALALGEDRTPVVLFDVQHGYVQRLGGEARLPLAKPTLAAIRDYMQGVFNLPAK